MASFILYTRINYDICQHKIYAYVTIKNQGTKATHLSRFFQGLINSNKLKILVYVFVFLGVIGGNNGAQLGVGLGVVGWNAAHSTAIQDEALFLLQLNVRGWGAGGPVDFVLPAFLWRGTGRHGAMRPVKYLQVCFIFPSGDNPPGIAINSRGNF